MKTIYPIVCISSLLSISLTAFAAKPLSEEGLSQVDLIQQREPETIVVNPNEAKGEGKEDLIEVTVTVPWDGTPRGYAVNSKTEEMAKTPEDKEAYNEARKRFLEMELANSKYRNMPEAPKETSASFPIVNEVFDQGSISSTPDSVSLTIPYNGNKESFTTPSGAFDVKIDQINKTLQLTVNLPK